MEYTENRSSKKLIIFEITCVLIIIALIGYTYSYFNVSVTNDTTISGRVASLSLTLNVSRVAPSNTNGLIPQLDQYITSAVIGRNGSCIDDNNNNVCQVYQIKVKNTSSVSLYANGTVTLDNKNNPNLKWAQISGTTSPTLVSSVNTPSTVKLVEDELFTANQEKIYYIVVWISETGEAQYDTGSFTGTVTFEDNNLSPAEETLVKLGLDEEVNNTKLSTFTTTSKIDGTTGIYEAEDDLGTSYYFRGNVTNNYVKFGKNSSNQNMYWRIIRINGDGSIRLIYDGTQVYANNATTKDNIVGTSSYNTVFRDNSFVGYMNGTTDGTNFPSGGTNSTSYNEAHTNRTNSTIKTYLDNWYKTNIVDTGYSTSVVDAIYCNDRTRVTDETLNTLLRATGEGFGQYVTTYSLYNRMSLSSEGMPESFSPTLLCEREEDKFTVSEELGNGDLTYPVGLITVDEMVYGGLYLYLGDSSIRNDESYLFEAGNYYWSMSPVAFSSGDGGSAGVVAGDEGVLQGGRVLVSDGGVRPVISISPYAIKARNNGSYVVFSDELPQ